MVKNICTRNRSRFCYVSFVLSLIFFISSVLVFAVMASAKTEKTPQNVAPIVEKHADEPEMQQKRIIKRLKNLEKKITKRKANE